MELRQQCMIATVVIREFEKIEIIRRNSGHYKMDYAVTKIQKIILSSLGFDETNICSSEYEISKLLASSHALMNRGRMDCGEEEID